MPILFNSLLAQFGLVPATVILLRHQDKRAAPGRTPYELWRDDRPAFEVYQSYQTFENRSKFSRASHWASFVATPDGATMFAGLYAAKYKGVLEKDTPQPHRDDIDLAGSRDVYDLQPDERLADLGGRVFIDWGDGTRAWVQRADNQNKPIIRTASRVQGTRFPGLSKIQKAVVQGGGTAEDLDRHPPAGDWGLPVDLPNDQEAIRRFSLWGRRILAPMDGIRHDWSWRQRRSEEPGIQRLPSFYP